MSDEALEANFDGLVGPTHNYGGHSLDNVASVKHKDWESRPKAAALQGLEKMRLLIRRGKVQGLLPPQERPHFPTLRRLGFTGNPKQIAEKAVREAPEIFYACCSASSMWAANAATLTPSVDTADNHLHITAANLAGELHRSLEAEATAAVLKKALSNSLYFTHHAPLPPFFADEGSANQLRFCKEHGKPGVHLFVYSKSGRQKKEAAETVARLHKILPGRALFAEQSAEAVRSGVFHNDVVSVGNRLFFLYHEKGFADSAAVVGQLQKAVEKVCRSELHAIEVKEEEVPLGDAVASYLFNSQIIDAGGGLMTMIVPAECEQTPSVDAFLKRLLKESDNPIEDVIAVNLKESMQNGGGPACLRMRAVLTKQQLQEAHPYLLLDEKLCGELAAWIEKYYPEKLVRQDLSDPELIENSFEALDALTQMLRLGPIYTFQR